MLEIKLNKDYKIITDDLNYTLYKKKDKNKRPKFIDEDAQVGWKVVGYYTDLDYLFSELIELEIKTSDVTQFQEIINLIKDLKLSLLQEFNKK